MINSQEIIERSIYQALLNASIKLGYSLDPNNYLPISIENQKRFKEDMDKLNKYIWVFVKMVGKILSDNKGVVRRKAQSK